jgi:hypothetical protein
LQATKEAQHAKAAAAPKPIDSFGNFMRIPCDQKPVKPFDLIQK